MVTIKLPTYVRREEPLRGRYRRFLAIFASGIRRELKRWYNIIALFLAIAFGIIFTIFTIFLASFAAPLGADIDASFFFGTLASPVILFFILIVGAAVGSGLIADDIRHMSLTLYLSRPITTLDYLLSKASIVAFAVVLAVAIPTVLGPIVAAILLYVTWDVAVLALLSGIAFAAIATVLLSMLVLMFSALTPRKGIAAAGAFASVLALQGITFPLREVVGSDLIFHLSIYENLLEVGRLLYGVGQGVLAWPTSLAILVGIILVSSAIAFLRIRSMEVVAPS